VAPSTLPYGITTADFNADGYSDVASANWNKNDVSVLLNDGAGNFSEAIYPVVKGPQDLISADFNGDGNLDLAVSNQQSTVVSILWGDGTGVFSAPENYAAGGSPMVLTGGDFNSDGNIDILTAGSMINTLGSVNLLLNQRPGVDTAPPSGSIVIDAGNAFTNTTAATLSLTCTDNVGCTQMQFSNDNITWNPLVANAVSASWTLAAGADGVRMVYSRFKDAAGNLSPVINDTITLDTLAPTAPVAAAPANNTVTSNTARPTISGTAEAGSTVTIKDGTTSLGMVTATGGNWNLATGGAVLTPGVHSFIITATDAAGNASSATTITYTVTRSVPVPAAAVAGSGGCVIQPNARFDPIFPALLLIGLGLVSLRRRGSSGIKKA